MFKTKKLYYNLRVDYDETKMTVREYRELRDRIYDFSVNYLTVDFHPTLDALRAGESWNMANEDMAVLVAAFPEVKFIMTVNTKGYDEFYYKFWYDGKKELCDGLDGIKHRTIW